MAETKKVITKTVNRSGKSLVKKALVVKAKKQSKISAENIKKLNERKLEEKKASEIKSQAGDNKAEEKKEVVKAVKKYNVTIGLKDLLNAGCHLLGPLRHAYPCLRAASSLVLRRQRLLRRLPGSVCRS